MGVYLPSLAVLLSFALASAALTITPGPDMTLFLSKTLSHSRAGGLAVFAGTTTGCLCHTTMVALGLSALLVASATAFTVLKIVGAGYLLWLAVDALRNGSSFQLDARRSDETLWRLYRKGLLVNLLNPKVIVFFITFLPQFVSTTDPEATVKLFVLGVLFVVVSAPIIVAMIFGAGSLARLLRRSPRATRAVDYVLAGVLGGFAVKLLAARA
ncbi:LysE family translocator [Acuticoccus mangrovi]|uniref:LysE family translocator n=1 Tax=Acuticoccus mangrovi TaxID=2796142 RepID=A0A934MH27_9HYPH|nr:LysE family translocator [Acuticoccus mangrovi]MBJ3777223.1 LysE family translocator [Acuticoccus mangrovi]